MKYLLPLILLASVLLVTVSAGGESAVSFHSLLTEVNHNGSLLPDSSSEPAAPGTLPKVELIPKAASDSVGKKMTVQFSKNEQVQSFYYYYNSQTGAEALAVILPAENFPLLVICRTEFGGNQSFVKAVESGSPFTVTVISETNISYQEGCMYAVSAAKSEHQVDKNEIISSDSAVNTNTEQICIGIVGIDSYNVPVTFMKTNFNESLSDGLEDNILVFHGIFERFDLMESVKNPNTGDSTYAVIILIVVSSLIPVMLFDKRMHTRVAV